MQFTFSKLIGFFLVPSNVIASLAVLALILLIFRRRSAMRAAGLSLVVLVAAGLSPIGNMLLTPLEQRFPEMMLPREQINGIIVLGGSYDSQSHGYLSTIVLREDTEPMAVMVALAKRYPAAKIIFSGGTDGAAGPSEASVVKQYFISFGIAPDRILVEGNSLTTAENARYTAQLINPPPGSHWLLVTSSYHMPRAIGAFRKVGFDVFAYSVGSRTHGWQEMWVPEDTATDNLRRLDIAVHEWLGLLFYWLSGRSDELFAR